MKRFFRTFISLCALLFMTIIINSCFTGNSSDDDDEEEETKVQTYSDSKSATFVSADDYIIYYFIAHANIEYTIVWTNEGESLATVCAGTTLDSSNEYFSSTPFVTSQKITPSASGNVYIKVNPYTADYIGTFTLTVTNTSHEITLLKENSNEGITENPIDTPTTTDTSTTTAKVAQYFWGTWQSMANGKVYLEISENSVNSYTIDDNGEKESPSSYSVSSSTDDTLVVQTLGTYTKQSDSVMLKGSIPYFRKGGANLSYTMQLVGFDDTSSTRVASSASLAGYTVTGTSNTYTSFKSETTSDADGNISLTAPVSGDVQTVTVSSGGSNIAVVPGITVENNNSNMGTIPISSAGQYSLKVTGTIDESEKDDGYLFCNKTYNMTLTITNVSNVISAPSVCTIEAKDNRLSLSSTENLSSGIIISTLKKDATKQINLTVKFNSMTEGFIDTGLIVTVQNATTDKEWKDFVPLRFYRGYMPITIAAESTESNSAAALNGFVIYPDGNSQFFSIPERGSKTIYVPSSNSENPYKLAFSGATVNGELSNSTEMLYTVAFDSWDKKEIDRSGSAFSTAVKYGELNDSEFEAKEAASDFQAYIADGDIDFYTFSASGSHIIAPENINTSCTITYQSEFGTVPSTQNVDIGTKLYESYLPTLTQAGHSFTGWYIGNSKVESGYVIQSNITLTAKWDLGSYNITYNLNNGTNSTSNPATYTVEDDTITLSEPTRNGYVFDGWYTSSDFTGSSVTQINTSNPSDITLYAKWIAIEYSISYSLNGGTNDSNNPSTYTIESDSITLAAPSRSGYEFAGWYKSANFSGNAITSIPTGSYGNITLTAKWDLVSYNITYNLNNGTNSTNNPATYTTEDETITLSEPTRNGYVFDGWYTSSDFSGTSVTQINTSNLSDITLYAKWIPIEYSISYSLNGGTNDSSNPSLYTAESDTITLAAPSRSGYEFAGWYESAKFSGSAVTSIPTASYGNITLYAKWKSSSGISVSIVGNSDIKVSKTSRNNGTELVFTADSGYDSYSWKLDDVEKSTSSTYVLSTSNLAKGYYLLSLEAKKGSKWHSYTVQVTIE